MIRSKKIITASVFILASAAGLAWHYNSLLQQIELASEIPQIEILTNEEAEQPSEDNELVRRSDEIQIIPYSETDMGRENPDQERDQDSNPPAGENAERPQNEEQAASNTTKNYKSSFLCDFSPLFRKTSLCSTLEGQIDFIDNVNSKETSPSAPADGQIPCETCALPEVATSSPNDQIPAKTSETSEVPSAQPELTDTVPQSQTVPNAPRVATKPKAPAPKVKQAPPKQTVTPAPKPVPTPTPSPEKKNAETSPATPQVAETTPANSTSNENESINYETCTAGNNYLEKQFDRHGTDGSNGTTVSFLYFLTQNKSRSKEFIKDSCFLKQMSSIFGPGSGIYGQCSAGDNSAASKAVCRTVGKGKKKRTRCTTSLASARRPCLSERYVNTVKNSFDIVTDCLKSYLTPASKFSGMSPAELTKIQNRNAVYVFALLANESGLHINASSPTGAGGMGQLTADPINVLNRSEIPEIRAYLSRPEASKVCQDVEKLYFKEPMRGDYNYNCDRIALTKGQPLKGIIYSYAHIKAAEDDILNYLKAGGSKRLSKFNLSAKDMDQLVMSLALWAHNTGSAGLTTPLGYLLNGKYAKQKVTNIDQFMTDLKKYMGSHAHPATRRSGSARIHETMNYFGKIAKIEQESRTQCLMQ